MAFRVSIDGQEGTTGLRPSDYLSQCDDAGLLRVVEDKCKDSAERAKFLNTAGATPLCLPDIAPHEAVSLVNNPSTCIIDTSTVFRTSDDWVYGLPELAQGQRECLRNTKRVAVSGCHVSAFMLLMRLLVDAGIVPANYPITVFPLAGYSGGDKQMTTDYLVANNSKPNNPCLYTLVLAHKHLPRMRVQSKLSLVPIFMPVVGNFLRDLAVAIDLHPQHLVRKVGPADIARVLADYYQSEQLIRVAPADNVATLGNGFSDAQDINDTNHTGLFVFDPDERMVVTVRLDNLGRDAAGAAVQCMNVHPGVNEVANLHMETSVPVVGAEHTAREAAPGFAS